MNQYNPYATFNPYFPQASINGSFPAQAAQSGMNGNVLRVSGINGVNALNIAPNASVLALDDTAPILWYIQTDSAGYKTPTAYDITPHVEQAAKVENDFEMRLKKVEEYINEQQSGIKSNASGAKRTKSADDSAD